MYDQVKQAMLSAAAILLVAVMAVVSTPLLVTAQSFDPLEKACDVGGAQQDDICRESGTTTDPLVGQDGVLTTAINLLTIVTAIIAVIIIVVSGIRMITSRGDPNAIATARNTIIYAGVGIVIVVMARTIVVLIANRL